jgi:hypothetical protein
MAAAFDDASSVRPPDRPGIVTAPLRAGLCALALTLTASAWGGNTAPQVAVAVAADAVGVAADVSTVRTGGAWSEGENQGQYRVIITDRGFDHIVSKLYLQWLEQEPEEGVPQVRATVAFAAFNEMPVYNLDIAEWKPQTNRLRVELTAYNSYSGAKCRFIVEAIAPGAATLTNRRMRGVGRCKEAR